MTVRKTHRKRIATAIIVAGLAGLAAGLALTTAAAAHRDAAAKPTITLGTKDFTEEFVLGQLYKQALEAKGYKVNYKENIGSTEIIDTALTSGKINAYPEYIGEIVQTVFHQTKLPKTAHGWWLLGKQLEEKRGFTLSNATPFFDVDAIAVRKADAAKYHLKSVPDLARVPNASIGARPEFKSREEGFKGMQDVYHLTKIKYVSIPTGLTYQALDQKKVFCINVFSTDAQLSTGKYVVLKDPKLVFGVQNVAVILKKNIATPEVLGILNRVSARLSQQAIVAMNVATQLNKKTPASVAKAFLKANGLA
jgi:osmoprotectant transport system substrate-binding protein